METKSNAATPKRPTGERPLSAPLLITDLPAALHQLQQEPTWASNDRNAVTLFKNKALGVVLTALHAGANLKTHVAPGVISVQVLKGRLAFGSAGGSVELDVGQVLVLQAGIPHSVTALEEAAFLLTVVAVP